MTRLFSNRFRHFDMGDLPTELLARDAHAPEYQAVSPEEKNPAGPNSINEALSAYQALFEKYLEGETAIARAPLPDELSLRSKNLKACAYFLDATLAGVCAIDASDGSPESPQKHTHALIFLIEFSREPKSNEPGAAWIHGSNKARTDARATEVAVVLAGYVRAMGYNARGHVTGNTHLNLEALAQRAGIARCENGVLKMPFLQSGFAIAAVSTDLPLEVDLPIATYASLDWPDSDAYMGKQGTRPGWAESEAEMRPLHLGRYPMESLKRVPEPTTLILRDEIIRNSKRADLFTRALAGDLGEKAKVQRTRFATKHPLAFAMTPLIRSMVPLQGTYERLVPADTNGALSDAQKNAESIKALAYFLGFETMEGASGDDWISGAQSMRSYMRGAFIAGVMGAHLRRLGYSSRAHTNAESDVLHIPATLLAGLGELSRIGELVLNPFIGPRSKSVLLTTDLPLAFDEPIDFGLQSVCNMCLKCARECPCNAIPFGPKVMFNGYEIWKPDVEKCGKYRLTNMKGSACGRCMKTCPYNREDLVESSRLLELSIKVPSARRALIDYDDQIGAGMRNSVKRWWFDLEIVNGVCISPSGVNERDLDLDRTNKLAKTQKLAFFPPHLQPRAETTMAATVPLDREAGLDAYANAEKPSQARKRKK